MIIPFSFLVVFYIVIACLMAHCSTDVELWDEELD